MAGTIDSSQGTEWPVVCAFYPDGAGDREWLTMERLYVSASRAKRSLVMVVPGGRQTLRAIASRHMPRRYSALGYALSHDARFRPLKQAVPEDQYQQIELVDPDELELLDDPRMPAVPRFPGRENKETAGTGGGKRRRR